jgi:uncharacterized membrane-anchored protein
MLDRSEILPSPSGRGAGGEGNEIASPVALTLTLSQRERGLSLGFERMVAWLTRHERLLLASAVGFQLFMLVGMIVPKLLPLWTGETVLLRIVPFEKGDMFRGNYATLSYDFSEIVPEQIQVLGSSQSSWRSELIGKEVCVSLVPEKDGKHWRMNHIGLAPPKSGKYIRGTITEWWGINFGIEIYYVQEEEGRRYEDAVRTNRLSAEIALTSDGRAAIRRLHVDPLADGRP